MGLDLGSKRNIFVHEPSCALAMLKQANMKRGHDGATELKKTGNILNSSETVKSMHAKRTTKSLSKTTNFFLRIGGGLITMGGGGGA